MFRPFLILLLALASSLTAATPNVIVILADDMGIGDVSHNGGKAPTPHLDRLAKEGMRFTDGHSASSVCTPTRYALVTGRYNWRSPLKKGVLGGPSPTLIRNGETTIAAFLGKHGYHSTVIGKWHLGLDWAKLPKKGEAAEGPTKGAGWDIDFSKKASNGPTDLGFSEDFLFPASLDMAPYVYLRNDEVIEQPTISATFWSNRWGPAVKGMEPEQCLPDFAREARAFIGGAAEAGKPFFLYLPLTSPHTPITPSERFQGKSHLGPYGDFLMETDWVVGEVMTELDERKLAEDTLLIFTTDNGCSPQAKFEDLAKHDHHPSGNLRGHKADIYEGGHRVPFLVRWPGKVAATSTSDRTICQTDIFATVAEAISQPLGEADAPDSVSFLPTLTGADQQARPATVHHSINGSFAIRKGPWKLCLCPGSGGWSDPKPNQAWKNKELPRVQLFELTEDLGETKNLEAEHPDKVEELVQELVTLINNGRTTPGPNQANHGQIPFHPGLLERFPALAKSEEVKAQ
ncbi:arylsulfatase [Haloferula sp. A504]|uniref:arylsulfatase n=1 Tax=Haloferula sp. A504 TaxID=3373601 RepID=UPI0031C0C1EA|nr:arylsulfatase [Verrucomicrobiaceae bacterium E54]